MGTCAEAAPLSSPFFSALLSASCLTLTRQDIIYSRMSICTRGLFLLHAWREQEQERKREKREREAHVHACTHARRQAYKGERERHLVELRQGERKRVKIKGKACFQWS